MGSRKVLHWGQNSFLGRGRKRKQEVKEEEHFDKVEMLLLGLLNCNLSDLIFLFQKGKR